MDKTALISPVHRVTYEEESTVKTVSVPNGSVPGDLTGSTAEHSDDRNREKNVNQHRTATRTHKVEFINMEEADKDSKEWRARFFRRSSSSSSTPATASATSNAGAESPPQFGHQETKTSLLGKPIPVTACKSYRQDIRYRRMQNQVYNFLERPRGWKATAYHIFA